jgi:hypothetical protein
VLVLNFVSLLFLFVFLYVFFIFEAYLPFMPFFCTFYLCCTSSYIYSYLLLIFIYFEHRLMILFFLDKRQYLPISLTEKLTVQLIYYKTMYLSRYLLPKSPYSQSKTQEGLTQPYSMRHRASIIFRF